ncbi:MAG: hypothetical protein PHE53_04300 [Thermoguttaceae bacterium]|nr:hypothetical protein [Thermoguttaceae bacterium]
MDYRVTIRTRVDLVGRLALGVTLCSERKESLNFTRYSRLDEGELSLIYSKFIQTSRNIVTVEAKKIKVIFFLHGSEE